MLNVDPISACLVGVAATRLRGRPPNTKNVTCGQLGRQAASTSLPNEHDRRKPVRRANFHAINIVPADALIGQNGSQGPGASRGRACSVLMSSAVKLVAHDSPVLIAFAGHLTRGLAIIPPSACASSRNGTPSAAAKSTPTASVHRPSLPPNGGRTVDGLGKAKRVAFATLVITL